jgi:hypothetical protein
MDNQILLIVIIILILFFMFNSSKPVKKQPMPLPINYYNPMYHPLVNPYNPMYHPVVKPNNTSYPPIYNHPTPPLMRPVSYDNQPLQIQPFKAPAPVSVSALAPPPLTQQPYTQQYQA